MLEKKHKSFSKKINDWLAAKDNLTIVNDVIVFSNQPNYAKNFGLQWNTFQLTQFDSHSSLPLKEKRLRECSEWELKKLKGKLVLEIGSGAGRWVHIY